MVPVLLAVLVAAAAAAGGIYLLKARLDRGAAVAGGGQEKMEIPKGTSALDFANRPQEEKDPAPVTPAPDAAAQGKAAVTGRVAGTEESKGSKTRYLKIAVEGAEEPRWVAYSISQKAEGMEAADLEKLKNKRVRINGDEAEESSHRKTVIRIRSRDQIELLD